MTYKPSGSSNQIICCQERLRVFCEEKSGYDPLGHKLAQASPNTLTEEQIRLVNSPAMNARTRYDSWRPFFDKPLSELVEVPIDVDLIDTDDGTYGMARQTVEAFYRVLTKSSGIADMAASKLGYLHRPKLIAISDHHARKLLRVPDSRRAWGPRPERNVQRGLAILDAVRRVGGENAAVLNQLADFSSTLMYKDGSAVELTKSRILDIYLWTEEAAKSRVKSNFWPEWYVTHQRECPRNVYLELS